MAERLSEGIDLSWPRTKFDAHRLVIVPESPVDQEEAQDQSWDVSKPHHGVPEIPVTRNRNCLVQLLPNG